MCPPFPQAILFYLPRHIWKNLFECGTMKFLTMGMEEPEISATKRTERVDRLENF